MNYHRIRQKVFIPLLVMPALLSTGPITAQDAPVVEQVQPVQPPETGMLDTLLSEAGEIIASGATVQSQIEQLSDQADELIAQFRQEATQVDALEVYNASMRATIAQQERTIAEYDQSINDAAQLQRQIPPLMERMMTSLEQFVALDIPFRIEERQARLRTVRGYFNDSSVNIAEKFRQVLAVYQQEIDYGRSIYTYTDTLEINGVERDVDILQVGRIALLYQTSDQQNTGVWDKDANQWVALDQSYRRPVATGISMASGLATTEILELPIPAPE